ncbi:hypothetical protein ANCDUO_16085 [Ancylostoma duodenale]|uniref:Kinase n=1 Tax=Ancylostoma duodenale TaxID=51022 RepID=A0A0C2FYS6_9BILA|nr:hypothetical protein ANCDUO_16085 [Ancylostoma duodenale]
MVKLRELRATLVECVGYRFFSSSLLFAFDADAADSTTDDAIRLRLIDFAHSTFPGFAQVGTLNPITADSISFRRPVSSDFAVKPIFRH